VTDYRGTSHHDLYISAQPSFAVRTDNAFAWVEALNIEQIWAVAKRWFALMQSGEARLRYPDPLWQPKPGRKPLTQDVADFIVAEMDEDFLIERGRFPRESGLGPEFSRLPPHARQAFAQELYDVMKTTAELKADATWLLETGWRPPGEQSASADDAT